MLKEIGRSPLPTKYGDWTYIVIEDDVNQKYHEMLVFGNIDEGSLGDFENVLVRSHSSCRTNEVYCASNCECRDELLQAMQSIQKEKRGIIIYMEQEGRGNGISGKLAQLNGMFGWDNGSISQKRDIITNERIDTDRAYKEAGYPSESRNFSLAGKMLKMIGVQSVRLLTNNPSKISGIQKSGIRVKPIEIHILPENEIILSDLKSKAKNLGHKISNEFPIIKR